jgi:Beta-propeller repeat
MYRALTQDTSLRRALLLIGVLAVLAISVLVNSLSQRHEGAAPAPQPAPLAATALPPTPQIPPRHQRQILEAYGKLPLRFEANAGQTDPQVQFLVRGSGSTLFLTSTEAVLAVRGPQGTSPVRLQLVGTTSTPQGRGVEELPGTSNYFIGDDPQQWHSRVPSYAKVVYNGIYPGVDLVYYGTQGRVEHDFIVAPGTSPSVIAFDVHGADQVTIDAHGDLVMATGAGDVRLRKPMLYQEVEGQRRDIPGGYVLTAEQRVGFQVGAYDATQPLVIDPVLVYATYLGGSGVDFGVAVAVDAAGQAYVTGFTGSLDFPVAGRPVQGTYRGGYYDAFVAKLNVDGSALVYATYLGGSRSDYGEGFAVDAAGHAYVMGFTGSPDFPVTGNAFQAHNGGQSDAFVAKLGTDTLPPVITITATPDTLWPPNGQLVPVTIVATITDAGSGVDPGTATYAVIDEYSSVEPSGSLTLRQDGRYTATIGLEASRRGNNTDGRRYTITVSVQDNEGNEGVDTAIVTVPQNQGQGQGQSRAAR